MARESRSTEQDRATRAEARRQALLLLCVSAVCAVAVLATRNLYDDEIASLPLITGSLRSIIQYTARWDVHPPGMYLLTHIAYRLLPSFRWMNLFPMAVLYAGLSAFVLGFAPLFANAKTRAWFLLLATLHPQLLLWGTSFRWYSWWTGLALATTGVALQPGRTEPKLSRARSCGLGVLLAALFYLNYVTLLFAVCLAVAMAVRYSGTGVRWLRTAWLGLAISAALAAPHTRTMLAKFAARETEQRMGIAGSVSVLTAATFASEAYLPWNPLAIAAGAVLAILAALWLWRWAKQRGEVNTDRAVAALVVLATAFFLLVGLSGLGGKPRTALLLAPAGAAAVACGASLLGSRLHAAALLLTAVWIGGGLMHMIGRTGLSKSMMINRPEQVVAFVQQAAEQGCAYVATYDEGLAYAISQARMERVHLISPYDPPIAQSPGIGHESCTYNRLYLVHSYSGGSAEYAAKIEGELNAAARLISGKPETARFSRDPHAAGRRALAHLPLVGRQAADAARLPDYRYTVVAGSIDAAAVAQLAPSLPDFCPYTRAANGETQGQPAVQATP